MTTKKLKSIWYDLEYEFDKNDDGSSPTVLYTSKSGLDTLIEGLQRIQSQGAIIGRRPLEVSDVDHFYGLPFSHVEISDAPPEDEDGDSYSMKPFIWGGLLVLLLVMLAGYGLFDLIKALF